MIEMEIMTLADSLAEEKFKDGEVICAQGEEGDFFYVVEKGIFTVIINGDSVASLSDGKCFGELALLYNTPRQATIRSQGVAKLFSLDRLTFRYILAKSSYDKIHTVQQALSKVTLLADLTPNQLHKISQAVEILKYEPGNLSIYLSIVLTFF